MANLEKQNLQLLRHTTDVQRQRAAGIKPSVHSLEVTMLYLGTYLSS